MASGGFALMPRGAAFVCEEGSVALSFPQIMRFETHTLPGQASFGAVVTGLDPVDIADPATRRALHELWIERGMLVFRGIEGGTETQIRLSEIYGELQDHPVAEAVPGANTKLSTIPYHPEHGDLYEVDGEVKGGWLPWHYDLVYVDRINRGGILRPLKLPKRGGETGFIDQIAAYAALPADLAARIEKLSVIYRFNLDSSQARFGQRADRCLRLHEGVVAAMERFKGRPRVLHPMVYEQSETGRKVLNVSPWFAEGIEGMENEQGDALLREVVSYATRAELAYYHAWQADDMVLWDNWRMMHCACGVPADERRFMQRTTIAGDYGRGRIEGQGELPDELRRYSV
jgi:taurine dioxygenase